jgi:hypothetical protein
LIEECANHHCTKSINKYTCSKGPAHYTGTAQIHILKQASKSTSLIEVDKSLIEVDKSLIEVDKD